MDIFSDNIATINWLFLLLWEKAVVSKIANQTYIKNLKNASLITAGKDALEYKFSTRHY